MRVIDPHDLHGPVAALAKEMDGVFGHVRFQQSVVVT
jgi:hypothetical protein